MLITGPRQSGKSTFLKTESSDIPYITFDDPLNREFALNDPNGFLNQFKGGPVVLDEIQYVPEILQYIKIRIDNDRKPGIWIMTGSQRYQIMSGISETLAGRIAILELLPFGLEEIDISKTTLEETIWTGLYPEPFCYPEKRELWINSYIQTYIERDVRQIANINDLRSFEIFINICAANHSHEFHPAEFSRSCGVSQPTIKSWSKILESSYFLLTLPPFFKNFNKRIIKTPKFYIMDPALAAYLTRQPSGESAIRGNMGGAIFEGLIVSDVWKTFYNLGKKPSVYFWRAQDGHEVDLIFQAQAKYWPVEIKMTSTPSLNHLKSINRFKKLAGEECSATGVLVCNIDKVANLPDNNIAIPWHEFPKWLRDII